MKTTSHRAFPASALPETPVGRLEFLYRMLVGYPYVADSGEIEYGEPMITREDFLRLGKEWGCFE